MSGEFTDEFIRYAKFLKYLSLKNVLAKLIYPLTSFSLMFENLKFLKYSSLKNVLAKAYLPINFFLPYV